MFSFARSQGKRWIWCGHDFRTASRVGSSMRALITGGAGFIGSSLAQRLCAEGWSVKCIDRLSPYYDVAVKRANAQAVERSGARFAYVDLLECDLDSLLAGIDVVFHQAGQPGVRASWGDTFAEYERDNILATQVLLEAIRHSNVARVVYASSSSVYGDNRDFPFTEQSLPQPRSPYGVTKLAAEHLMGLYASNFGIETVSLRYFTVYGPRQRPDMAIHRLIKCALTGEPFLLNGDGSQERDFTFVEDIVEANVLAATGHTSPGSVFNVGGGSVVTLAEVIEIVEAETGFSIKIDRTGNQPGDVRRTGADTQAVERALGWQPRTGLADGIRAQVAWHKAVARQRTP